MKIAPLFKHGSLYVFILFVFFACKKKDNPETPAQKIYFEHYVINYAWGLNYIHWIIDDLGNVKINRKKDSIIWIKSSNLNNGLNNFDSIIYKVDKNELTANIKLIEAASKGKVDSIVQHRADFGSTAYNCYWYDKSKNTFRTVILSNLTDTFDQLNTDSSAILINIWLNGLNSKINSKK